MSERSARLRMSFTRSAIAALPKGPVRRLAQELDRAEPADQGPTVVVGMASDFLVPPKPSVPEWVDSDTRYLIVADVVEPAILRMAAVLGLHKPHLRLHVSRDHGVIKRLVLAQSRTEPWEGIVDAYPLGEYLIVVHGDMTMREFPKVLLPRVRRMGADSFRAFSVDDSGSFLHWKDGDVHLGASQLLQAVDPMYLTDVEIQRYARQKVSLALLDMRHEQGLKQTEIEGLSDRQVRRLENEEVRLTVDAAEAFAAAFGLSLSEFLSDLSQRLSALSDLDTTAETPTKVVGAG